MILIGLFGVLSRKDAVAVLASIEVMLGGPLLLLVGLGATARTGAFAQAGAASVQGIALLVIVVIGLVVDKTLFAPCERFLHRRWGTARQ